MSLFNRKKSPLKLFKEKKSYPVEPVFEIAGKTFYAFTDINNQPSGRTLAALPLYIQLKRNCDDEYLTVWVAAEEAALNDPAKISIEKIINLKNQIKDRLTWAFTPDLVYKFASVIYFDENENPETFDEEYNQRKIKFWKDHLSVVDFFLTEPIMRLVPALADVKSSFPSYLDVILKAQRMQLDYLLDILSTSRMSPEDTLNLSSVITGLKDRYASENYPLTSTSSLLMKSLNTSKS